MGGDWSDSGLAAIARVVEEETGLSWPAGRRDSAEAAIFRAMDRARVTGVQRYLELIRTEAAAREELIAELTVGETYFLRDNSQFATLRDILLPDMARAAGPDRELRLWSAGCASGEEPYSLAIVLAELGLGGRARVLGTDIARHRLAAARAARYTRWSLRGVPPTTVQRYFRQTGRHFLLDAAIRDAVEFRYLNLAEDLYPSLSSGIWGMDLILCRNVLIYFDRETVARVAARLIGSLAETGWLMLGASDPPIAEYIDCEVVVVGDGIAYRRADVAGRTATRSAFSSAPQPAQEASPFFPPDWTGPGDPFLPRSPDGSTAVDPAAPAPFDPARPAGHAATSDSPAAAAAEPGAADADSAAPAPAGASDPAPEATVPTQPAPPAAEALAAAYAVRDYERAANLAAAEIAAGHDDVGVWIVRVRALANLGRLADASRACSAALGRHADSAELNYLLSVLLAEADRPADAAAVARKALYLDRGLVVAHLALADAAARAGDAAAARRSLRNAARLLEALPPAAEVRGADGESAGRLAELVRTRLRLMEAA